MKHDPITSLIPLGVLLGGLVGILGGSTGSMVGGLVGGALGYWADILKYHEHL